MNGMTFQEWASIGSSVVVAAMGLIYGVFQAWRASGKRKVEAEARDLQRTIEAKEQLIGVAQESASAWRQRYEDEHREYKTYREDRHRKDNELQEMIMRTTAENTQLRIKTDLSPILEQQRQHAEVQVKMLESLAKISAVLDVMMKHVGLENEAAS